MTKLGRLVKAGKITSMEQIYLHSLPVKEYQIVDFFLPKLKDEVMKVRIRNLLRNGFAPMDVELEGGRYVPWSGLEYRNIQQQALTAAI